MAVSRKDREHMRRIGAIKSATRAEALQRHLALSIEERQRRSWQLYLDGKSHARNIVHDDPTPFYERARALGLYRP